MRLARVGAGATGGHLGVGSGLSGRSRSTLRAEAAIGVLRGTENGRNEGAIALDRSLSEKLVQSISGKGGAAPPASERAPKRSLVECHGEECNLEMVDRITLFSI